MPLEFALLSLQIIVGFVVLGGLVILLQREWEGVPEPARSWLLERTHGVKHIAVRHRRARKVDQFALCRINRLMWHHQRRVHAEMPRETKPETARNGGSLTEVRIMHDPQMIALVKLVNAKLVTQTAGLEALFGVKAGENAAYKMKVEAFRAARAYLNLHGDHPPVLRSDTETRRANAA